MSISIKGITKSFNNRRDKKSMKTVLEDISFDVNEGEKIWKTLILKIIQKNNWLLIV